MKLLVACEESQMVCKAFRNVGIEAYSCDIQECSGGHPEWHIVGDAITEAYSGKYGAMIAHPPCTYLSKAGARWMYRGGKLNKERYELAMAARDFFMKLLNSPIKYKAIENPRPLKVTMLPKASQVIQPSEHGHEFTKATLLWLKNLPPLFPTKIMPYAKPYLPSNTGGKKRGQRFHYTSITKKQASKTFEGIANAMAEQWKPIILGK